MNEKEIYQKAFALMGDAFAWSATGSKSTAETFNYVWGVYDMAQDLLLELGNKTEDK